MWPFHLPGPQFLVFYATFGGLVILAEFLLRHMAENEDTPKVNLSDPYLIAFLRGGKNETLRVATMSLIDRKLLSPLGAKIEAPQSSYAKVSSSLEQKVV